MLSMNHKIRYISHKEMKKNIFLKRVFVIAIFGILLTASGVFAETIGLTEDVKEIIEDIVLKNGINEENITSIEPVDYNNLPDAIDIENIDDTNLVIYQVYYEGDERPVYVITASDELFEGVSIESTTGEILVLDFGYEGEMKKKDEFLKTATGIETSLEKGYVMMRDGSITGISTNLEIVKGEGEIEILIYRNGKVVEFGNNFVGDSEGVKKDYDVQSEDTVKFEAGDVISLSIEAEGDVVWKDVITMVEIITIR